jgi:hypothetical protein
MVCRLKTLGLALVAVLAMSTVAVTAAQATVGKLTTEGKTVIATAEQVGEHEFSLTDHELEVGKYANSKCKKAVFTGIGSVTTGATSSQVHPVLSECIAFGQSATITTTGCDYLFKFGTPTAGGWHVTTDIICSGASVIKIVTSTCEVTIGGQTGLSTSEVTNSGSSGTAMDLLLHTSVTGIKYTVVKDTVGCPLKGTGIFSKGDQVGTTTATAHDWATQAPVGITINGEEPPPHEPSGKVIATGEQVGVNTLQLTEHLVSGGEPANAKCNSAKFTGTEPVGEVEKSLRIHPEYKECTAFGQPATITTTNCDYLLNIGAGTVSGWDVAEDIVCSGGSVIKIVTGTCEVTIGSQNGLTTSEVTNSGTEEAMDLLLHTSVTGIKYTVVKDNIGCPLSGKGEFSKGDYSGETTLKAHDSGNKTSAGITVNAPSFAMIATGEQVGENALQLTDHLISGQPASVKCTTAKFTGTEPVIAVEGELQVHPVFEGCTAFGSAATITTTNCDYLLTIGAATAGGWHVTTDVVCSAGSAIKIVAGNCEVTIGSQVGLTTSEVENSGTEENMDMLLHTNIGGIHYTVAKDGTGCPLSGTGNFSQGDYTGTTTVKAHDAKTLAPVGITKN